MNLNTISQIIFYVGISVGIVCASKLPVDGTTYPDTLIPFLVSVLVSILGLVGWRRTSVSSKADESANSPDNPQKLLADLKTEMDRLSELQNEKHPLEEIQNQVKKIIENFLIPISSRQQDLYRDLGMERAAHILITLSPMSNGFFIAFKVPCLMDMKKKHKVVSLRLSKDIWNSKQQSLYFSIYDGQNMSDKSNKEQSIEKKIDPISELNM